MTTDYDAMAAELLNETCVCGMGDSGGPHGTFCPARLTVRQAAVVAKLREVAEVEHILVRDYALCPTVATFKPRQERGEEVNPAGREAERGEGNG